MVTPRIGILALQGAVQPHVEKIRSLAAIPILVKKTEHLNGLKGIILPGGESTTMLHLLKLNELWKPLNDFVRNKPTWGICAGAILLANEVTAPSQGSLKAIDITIERNAYGRQTESFSASLNPTENWTEPTSLTGLFIRAPRIRRLGNTVKPLFTWKDEPVLVRAGSILLGTFHPELTNDLTLHQYFINLCSEYH